MQKCLRQATVAAQLVPRTNPHPHQSGIAIERLSRADLPTRTVPRIITPAPEMYASGSGQSGFKNTESRTNKFAAPHFGAQSD